jgi:hypothetical protein
MQSDTFTILNKFAAFVLQDPVTYLKNSLRKLSCFFSPNQIIIYYIKTAFKSVNVFIIDLACLGLSLLYIFIVCGGVWGMLLSRDVFRPIFIVFIIFYSALIFLTVGNSKLRLPLMPFFIIYCSYFIACLQDGKWKTALSNKMVAVLILIFLANSIYKYQEIRLSPTEILIQKIELCIKLGFPKTALHFLEDSKKHSYTDEQSKRLQKAKASVSEKLKKETDNNQMENP